MYLVVETRPKSLLRFSWKHTKEIPSSCQNGIEEEKLQNRIEEKPLKGKNYVFQILSDGSAGTIHIAGQEEAGGVICGVLPLPSHQLKKKRFSNLSG